ncbi:MAG: hypothetical protein JO069_17395 [Verrucomicrobia bacterium]|nr:hypothetical protein [Verrucomicrobiota bacterium]
MPVNPTGTDANPGTQPGSTFAVVCPVGPGEKEIERVRDLIDSLEAFEPGNYHFVLVDDDQGSSRFHGIVPSSLRDRYIEVKNPRRGEGAGWAAGCAVAVLAGLDELLRRRIPFTFALKLDTDSLVIGPFSQVVTQEFHSDPRAGMIGTLRDPRLAERADEQVKPLGRALDKLMKQFTVWRGTAAGGVTVQIALWGRFRRIRDTIREAFINGFRVGEHCYGGGYALSRACVEALAARGLVSRPRIWIPTPLVEDMIMSLCVLSAGFTLQDFSGEQEPFAVRYRGLPDTPERLVARGHSIVHSVKDFNKQGLKEAELRSFFRELRSPSRPLQTPRYTHFQAG